MTPAELREKMARAICLALGDDPNREGKGVVLAAYAPVADAVLRVVREAMREPSEEMIEGAAIAMEYDDMGRPISWNHTKTWRAMLAASPLREPGA